MIFRLALAWFCLLWAATVVLYAIFGRCLAAKITCGLWLGPFAIGYIAWWALLAGGFCWNAGSMFLAWFADPFR